MPRIIEIKGVRATVFGFDDGVELICEPHTRGPSEDVTGISSISVRSAGRLQLTMRFPLPENGSSPELGHSRAMSPGSNEQDYKPHLEAVRQYLKLKLHKPQWLYEGVCKGLSTIAPESR